MHYYEATVNRFWTVLDDDWNITSLDKIWQSQILHMKLKIY